MQILYSNAENNCMCLVSILKCTDGGHASIKTSPERSPQESPSQKLNRDIVLKDIVDSERVNVAELQGLMNNFLQPLETSNM